MNEEFKFGLTFGALLGLLLGVMIVLSTSYTASKLYWSCTRVSQPKNVGEQVQCLQYTKD